MPETLSQNNEEFRRLWKEHYDKCTLCGHRFKQNERMHVGYSDLDRLIIACDDCLIHIKKKIYQNIIFSPRPYIIPSEDSILWRYIDFTKYMSMLSSGCLYFARADCFPDIFEGARGIKSNKEVSDDYHRDRFRKKIKTSGTPAALKLSKKDIDKQFDYVIKKTDLLGIESRLKTYINCWHESDHESEAMWRLYSSYIDNAIAIRTTYKRLYDALGRDLDITIGRVKYIDYQKTYIDYKEAYWRKRLSLKHEKEVRVIKRDPNCRQKGTNIKCKLPILIEKVYVYPSAPNWFINLVNDVNEDYGLNIKVSPSELGQKPFY